MPTTYHSPPQEWDSDMFADRRIFDDLTLTSAGSPYINSYSPNNWQHQTLNAALSLPSPSALPTCFELSSQYQSPYYSYSQPSTCEASREPTPQPPHQYLNNMAGSSHTTATTTARSPSECQSSDSQKERKKTPCARIAHTQVERKYRQSLNTAIKRLQRVIPDLADLDDDFVSVDGRTSVTKPTKASVIIGGVAYIKQLEKEQERLKSENIRLRKYTRKELVLMDQIMYGADVSEDVVTDRRGARTKGRPGA